MIIKVIHGFLALFLLSLIVGCGEKLPYQVAGISGTITFEGKPAPKGLRLQFMPLNGEGRSSEAIVGDEGKFKARYSRSTEGVQVGKVNLIVGWSKGPDASAPQDAAAIIKKYGMGTAGVPLEITKAEKEFKIELK